MNNPEYAFWNDYTITLEKLAIPEAKINYYVLWVKRFRKFLNGVPFNQIAPDMVAAFLSNLQNDDISTTMIYTHVLDSPGIYARSPADA